ncbi:hypothetical protein Q5P01_003214 [Channa striata]|uniref:Uncharacterized protein n=1 Tax=Channa striata TaxID=64152 RepID=A0AA88NGP6_CHASR|nr:hypothetical protein Q5P01_003214 [Channa striata]
MQDSLKSGVSETDNVNNNHCKNSSQDDQNRKILLVDNRVHISSQSPHCDETHCSSSTCVTETLVYSIKSKVDTAPVALESTTPKPLQHSASTPVSMETRLSQQQHTVHRKQEARKPHSRSNPSSSGSSSTDSQSWDEGCKSKVKVLGKSRFFSVESTNEQSPKRSRFGLKKSVSTPNPSLCRSDSERINKTNNNKMDQMLNRLRQTFSNKRSDDDQSFPWKWKRASQTPSVSGSSDISSVSDVTVESTRTLQEREQGSDILLKDKDAEETSQWAQNKYTIVPPYAVGRVMAGNQFSVQSDELAQITDQDEQNTSACAEHKSDGKTQIHLRVHSPTQHPLDFYKDNMKDYKPRQQFLICRDTSPGSSPDPSSGYPHQIRKSTSSPRSPFSPFSSLSPLSPFSSPDATDDSVFYSPKLQRRRESSSPCEPGEGFSLGASRRSRASTGPPSASPVQDKVDMASSYADLKYGIEPGRSFSVSSVLSSRPSGPGRISTGSRFMSVGDLSASALTCGVNEPNLPSDPGKMRSRSLPRSLTRRLANWSSGVPISQSVINTASKPSLRSPNRNTCHFAWDTEGPPTPPPTPPLSPVTRRMSKPSSVSSPTFSSSPGALQHTDSQSSRGHLPSRGYVSSLSTFEESSDSSSDTTTDDEYYLETGVDDEKETEL